MFKRVDIDSNEKLEGFSYLNQDGDEETVSLPVGPSNVITLLFTDGEKVYIYKEDIPKLIKALEAVYNYKD